MDVHNDNVSGSSAHFALVFSVHRGDSGDLVRDCSPHEGPYIPFTPPLKALKESQRVF